MKKKILILLGHPNTQAETGALADAYERGAQDAGHELRRMNLADMQFDPVLHKGYTEIQELEPDLHVFQENVMWADHFVLLYPAWFRAMPALLKGLFDRAWLPGFAFRFKKKGVNWDKLLKGKTARLIVRTNIHWLRGKLLFGDFTNEVSRGLFWLAGYKVRTTIFSPSERAPEKKLESWREKVYKLGVRGM